MSEVPNEVAAALVDAAQRMAAARGPWWIIGSAAVTLHGARTDVADIDVLAQETDARAVLDRAGIAAAAGAGSERFRSAVLGRIAGGALPIEVMGGLSLHSGSAGWEPLSLRTREPVLLAGATLWVPARAELIELLRRFGRDKDLARAALLEAPPGG